MEINGLIADLDQVWADHGERVRTLARHIGQVMGLSEQELTRLEIAALLHDIGKADLDPRMLAAPRPLTDDEWVQIRRHPHLGFEKLEDNVHPDVAVAVLTHHERHDGRGYPFGLSGNEIPPLARILAVADAYDAIVSERPYDRAHSPAVAIRELSVGAGTQFDPRVVDAFLDVIAVPISATPHLASTRAFAVA